MTPGSLRSVAMARIGPCWAGPGAGRRGRRAKLRHRHELGQLAELGRLVLGRCCAAWAVLRLVGLAQ
jgi:hypothetical protein